MSHRLRTFLELVRLPNLFTAPPDVIAGACAAGAILDGMPAARWLPAGALCLAAMHLYAGGVALNDVMDAERDETDRRDRPIPSQRISRAAALRVSILLLTAGMEGYSRVSDKQVVKMARRSGVSIYPVYLMGHEKSLFDSLARQTGGASFNLREMRRSLDKDTGKRVFEVLRGHYLLTVAGNLALSEKAKLEINRPGKWFVSMLALE